MVKPITIYHGSEKIIEQPTFGAGKLGEQLVIKSRFAFSRLKHEGFDLAEKRLYYVRRKARNDEANRLYLDMLEEGNDGLYIQDIIRGGIKNNDPRIPRNVSE